ncbi:MAG: STAS domain-containing protein [Solirubrobacteraceae bacterium]
MAGESQGASPFEISTVAQKGGQVITPEGELDLTTVPLLEQRLNQALLAGDTVLELSRVSFIDSTGIALLVSVSATAREHGWHLELRDPSPQVERLIKLTGVTELLGSPGE